MALIGTSTTITFGTSGWTGEIASVDGPNETREAIDTTHLGTTGNRTFTPATLVDSGEVSLTCWYDPDEPPPIDGAAETITITWPVPSGLSNGATAEFTGFITSVGRTTPLEEKIEGSITIKASGDITFTDAS